MKKFYNPSIEFGESGPFEAKSRDDLANQWDKTFTYYAEQMWYSDSYEKSKNLSKERYIELKKTQMRADFITNLEEIDE
jgi:hypothetical protein